MRRRISCMILAIMMAFTLTGCDATLSDIRANTDNLDNVMMEIVERNIAIISELYNAGLLNSEQRTSWEKSVKDKCAALMNTADEEYFKKLGITDTDEIKKKTKATFAQFEKAMVSKANPAMISDEDVEEAGGGEKFKTILDASIDAYGEAAAPLMLFDDASVTTFLKDLNRPVYVLNTSRITNGVDDTTGLKYMQLAMAILKSDIATLDNIVKAEHMSDTTRIADVGTIAELKQNINNLSAEQQKTLEKYVLSFFKKTDYNLASLEVEDIFVDSTPHPSVELGQPSPANETNYDVVISADGLAALTLRVHELNKNLIPFLRGFSSASSGGNGLSGNYYLLKSDKIALKLDYKLETISDIYTGSVLTHGAVSDETWECKTEATDYTISIYDGSMVTEDGNRNAFVGSPYTSRSIEVHPTNTYKTKIGFVQRYTTGKDNVAADEVKSDEIDFTKASIKEMDGDTEYTCFYKKDGSKVYAHYNYGDCPTVILKDYMEYNYFPGVIADENFIATGRMMRVKKLSGGKDDIEKFAEAITKNGTSFDIPIYISLKNIIDHQSGQGYYEGVSEKLGLGEDNTAKVTEELAKDKDSRQEKIRTVINPGMLDGDGEPDASQSGTSEKSKASKKLQLSAYFNWIQPVEVFGTKEDVDKGMQAINTNDAQSVKDYIVPTMWGMFTGNSVGETLWGSWVTADSSRESGSLAWFVTWLKENKFSYSLTKEMILDSETVDQSSFKKGGNISVDLDTVAKVQLIQDERYGFNLERTIRTASRIVGMIIMLYGLSLLGAWVVDVNIEGGPKLLKKLTANKWIAIRDTTGLPSMPPDGTQYMGFISLGINVFIILCLGVVLIVLDIIDIRDIVLNLVDNIFEAISNVLFK